MKNTSATGGLGGTPSSRQTRYSARDGVFFCFRSCILSLFASRETTTVCVSAVNGVSTSKRTPTHASYVVLFGRRIRCVPVTCRLGGAREFCDFACPLPRRPCRPPPPPPPVIPFPACSTCAFLRVRARVCDGVDDRKREKPVRRPVVRSSSSSLQFFHVSVLFFFCHARVPGLDCLFITSVVDPPPSYFPASILKTNEKF